MQTRTTIGIIGCGNISSIYLKNCASFGNLTVKACADLDLSRAQARAAEFNIPVACTVQDLLADPDVQAVVNLTVPKAHAEVALAAVRANKSVYNEKPLTIERHDAATLLLEAREHGVRVGCAPDTFLGGGLQTCRALIDAGEIGQPVAATAFMLGHGPEGWHPDPEFFYKRGAGPMFDMGPYYLTALVALLGPIQRVTGSTRISFPQRTITSQPHAGTVIDVEVPTHVIGVLEFAAGAMATLVTSFDVWAAQVPRIEIYGSAGTLSVPDPNTFGGPVRVRRAGDVDWREVPIRHGFTENSRGLGMADMADAIQHDRPHRASGALAYHVLDVMHTIHDAASSGQHMTLLSTCEQPAPLAADQQY